MSKEYDITELLTKLIGSVDWYGETNADSKSYDNLVELEEAIIFLWFKLKRLVETRESNPDNYSAKRLGDRAEQIINELLNNKPELPS